MLEAERHGSWLDVLGEELDEDGGTLVLADVDLLPAEAVGVLAEALEPLRESTDASRRWVVATTGPGTPAPGLARLLACFPRTIEVPPLRHHIEDVPDLVRHFAARQVRGSDLSWSPEAMRVLRRNRWPGNVEQLQQVVAKVVSRRRSGVIEIGDLPSEIGATVRRVLTPIEAIECDAIVNALLETSGNKARAAALLGMSRATVYRKVREYGITVPPPAGPRHGAA